MARNYQVWKEQPKYVRVTMIIVYMKNVRVHVQDYVIYKYRYMFTTTLHDIYTSTLPTKWTWYSTEFLLISMLVSHDLKSSCKKHMLCLNNSGQ